MQDINITDELNALKSTFEEGTKALKHAQETMEGIDIKKLDALDIETLKKTGEDVAKAIEAQNALDAKIKSMEENEKKHLSRIQHLEMLGANGTSAKTIDPLVKAYSKSMDSYIRRGVHSQISHEANEKNILDNIISGNPELDPEELNHVVKTLSVGSNPDGGFFVTSDNRGVIEGRIFETSNLRAVANVITTSRDQVHYVLDDDEADSGWVGEVCERGDTGTPQVGEIIIPVHEQYAQPKITQKLLDDPSFNAASWLNMKVSSRLSRKENEAFINGDGAQKPKGILSYGRWKSNGVYERNALEHVAVGATAFNADQIKLLQTSLIEEYQPSAVWGLKRLSFWSLQTLKDSSGNYLLGLSNPNRGSVSEREAFMLLSKPIIFMNDMQEVGANAKSIMYGDFGEGYTIVDRLGIRVLRDPFTNKPYIKFYTTKYVGGAVTNYEAIKIGINE